MSPNVSPTAEPWCGGAAVRRCGGAAVRRQDEKKTITSSMMRFYPHPKLPKWLSCVAMGTPRYVFGLVPQKSRLLAIGGLTEQGEYSVVDEKPCETVEAFDAGSNMWGKDGDDQDVPGFPVPVRGVATACLDGIVYAVAGDVAFKLGDGSASWVPIAHPAARTHHLSMVPLGGYLYAFGGVSRVKTGKMVTSASHERYDPVADCWEPLAPMANPRHSIAAAVLGGKIYACGGTSDTQDARAVVEVYHPDLDLWKTVGPMIRARGAASANVLKFAL